MNRGRQYINILNILNAIALVLLTLKFLHLVTWLQPIGFVHALIALGVILFLKNWVLNNYEIQDPIRLNRSTNALYNMGMGVIVLAVLFRIMHWPYGGLMIILGTTSVVLAYILSLVLEPSERDKYQDILDDFND